MPSLRAAAVAAAVAVAFAFAAADAAIATVAHAAIAVAAASSGPWRQGHAMVARSVAARSVAATNKGGGAPVVDNPTSPSVQCCARVHKRHVGRLHAVICL